MTSIPPPIKTWFGNDSNRCVFDEIPTYWKAYDIITFLADLRLYHSSLYNFLDDNEKEKELLLKAVNSKKRFVVSRTIIKHILLNILEKEKISDIVLIKRKHGRVLVEGNPTIYISLSYSGTKIAITVGKRKLGNDIEVLRPVGIKKIRSYPLFNDRYCMSEKEYIRDFLHIWTLIEAYSKLRDRNPYLYLNSGCLPEDAHLVSYCIDNHSIFSLAFGPDQLNDALLWIDPGCIGTFPSVMKKAVSSSKLSDEDKHVRT